MTNKIERFNFWRCPKCNGILVTVDIALGVVPEKLQCRISKGCQGVMSSAGYPDPAMWPIFVHRDVEAVWYRPSTYEKGLMKKRFPKLYDHVNQGGLVLRPPKKTEMFTLPTLVGYGS